MATKNRAPKKSSIAVDFSDTETQAALEEGDYQLIVDEVEKKESDGGNDYLAITFKVEEGPFVGKKVYHNCSLQPQALFNLRGVLEALGFEVPQGVMELDPADMVGESCGAALVHETYQGKTKARPAEFFTVEELATRGEEAEAPKKGKAKPEPEAPTKVVKKGAKPAAKDEEEEETPPPAAKSKKKAPAKKAEPEFEVGDTVTFTDDEGNELTGEILSEDDGTFTVKTGIGKKAEEWELTAEDLTKEE